MTARAALFALALLVATPGQAGSYAPDDWPRGWLFAGVVDGDTLAFAVPGFPGPLARILVLAGWAALKERWPEQRR